MKKIFYLICTIFFWTACTDDQWEGSVVAPTSGDEVLFGAGEGQYGNEGTPATRTVYYLDTYHGQSFNQYSYLNVRWTEGDKVRIYSPDAQKGYQTANYTVTPNTDAAKGHLVKLEDTGIRWGDTSKKHRFYAFYPSEPTGDGADKYINMSGLETEAVVKATIPVAQEHGQLYEYDATTPSEQQTPGGKWKIIAPDMHFSMMTATQEWTPGQDRTVALDFTPIVTMMDVLITAGDTPYKVNAVMIRSKSQAIVGEFTYNYETKQFEGFPDANVDNTIATVDCTQNGSPITLESGDFLNVKFFLLPRDINAADIQVSVLLEGGYVLTKSLHKVMVPQEDGTETEAVFKGGSIVKIRTPKLKVESPNNWMSLIHDDVYFASQLSLPGTKHSFTYTQLDESGNIQSAGTGVGMTTDEPIISLPRNSHIYDYMLPFYQTKDIEYQFNAGVRAFNVSVTTDAKSGEARIYAAQKVLSTTLEKFLEDLSKLVNANQVDGKPTEAAVVSIDYVNYSNTNKDSWTQAVINHIAQTTNAANIFHPITAETTMGEMRGKIGIMIHQPEGTTGSYSSSYAGVVKDFSSSVQNREIVQYSLGGNGALNVQNLIQLNNPQFLDSSVPGGNDTEGVRAEVGLLPYYLIQGNYNGTVLESEFNLVEKKQMLMGKLFGESRDNQSITNLYMNDLSGFCVVDDGEYQSTGYGEFDVYTWARGLISGYDWRDRERKERARDFRKKFTYNYKDDSKPSQANSGETWCAGVTDENAGIDKGQGGNTVYAAQLINPIATQMIYELVKEGRAPLGLVYINFAGVNKMQVGTTAYGDVAGMNLPGLIVSNNFKFALKRKPSSAQ